MEGQGEVVMSWFMRAMIPSSVEMKKGSPKECKKQS
jgi:hypothetical protein